MPECDDLRLGGTLSSAGISGGISINSTAYSVVDWSTIFGTPGQSGSLVEVFGRPGNITAGDRLPLGRFLNLNIAIKDRDQSGGLTEPTAAEQKQANTDAFLSLLMSRDGTFLEVDTPDGTSRFLHVRNNSPAPINQPRRLRTIRAPLESNWGFWREGGVENDQTVNGADTITVVGETVYDAVLEFSGDGTFTHNGLGWAIEVTGSSGVVTVDLGARTVTEGGVAATNRIRRTPVAGDGRLWGWFPNGSNSVNSTVPVDVIWRTQHV